MNIYQRWSLREVFAPGAEGSNVRSSRDVEQHQMLMCSDPACCPLASCEGVVQGQSSKALCPRRCGRPPWLPATLPCAQQLGVAVSLWFVASRLQFSVNPANVASSPSAHSAAGMLGFTSWWRVVHSRVCFCHGGVTVPGAVAVCAPLWALWKDGNADPPPFPSPLELIDVTERHPVSPSRAVRLLWAPFSALHDADGPLGSFLRFLSRQDSASWTKPAVAVHCLSALNCFHICLCFGMKLFGMSAPCCNALQCCSGLAPFGGSLVLDASQLFPWAVLWDVGWGSSCDAVWVPPISAWEGAEGPRASAHGGTL